MKKIKFTLPLFISLLMASCFYDNEEDLFQIEPGCETENVTLSEVVKPILQNRCYGCHSTGNSLGAGIELEEYNSLILFVGNDGTGGQFLKSIKHEAGASPMPKSAGKIPDCEIEKISAWIANGALND